MSIKVPTLLALAVGVAVGVSLSLSRGVMADRESQPEQKETLPWEDARLLAGGGSYSDDVNLPGQAYACFVRSPHAHARIGRIDAAAALAIPGVIAVLSGLDAEA